MHVVMRIVLGSVLFMVVLIVAWRLIDRYAGPNWAILFLIGVVWMQVACLMAAGFEFYLSRTVLYTS